MRNFQKKSKTEHFSKKLILYKENLNIPTEKIVIPFFRRGQKPNQIYLIISYAHLPAEREGPPSPRLIHLPPVFFTFQNRWIFLLGGLSPHLRGGDLHCKSLFLTFKNDQTGDLSQRSL